MNQSLSQKEEEVLRKADYQVKNKEIETKLKGIGEMIGKSLPKGWGFNLMIFSFGKGGSMFYISNGSRNDVIKAMLEFISKQKEGEKS